MAVLRTIEGSENVSHVVLTGRLDVEGVTKVELPLTAATVSLRRPTIIDMTEVDFLGSLGIGVLVRCAVSLQRSGLRLVLFGCQPMVRRTLEVSRVTAVMPLADSETDAVALVNAR